MPYDLSALARVEQRFVRRGTSLFIETFNKDTSVILDSFEFKNAPLSVPGEVYEVARQRLTGIASPASGASAGVLASAISAYNNGLRTRPPIILGIGDSNFTAQGAGSGNSPFPASNGAFSFGPMERIVDHASTIGGLTVRNTAWFGDGNSGSGGFLAPDQYNPNMTVGAGWVNSTVTAALVGALMESQSGTTGIFEYRFGSPVTHVEFFHNQAAGLSAGVNVMNSAGVVQGTISSDNASTRVWKTTVTGAFPDGVVRLQNTGTAFYCAGMLAWNANEKSIVVARCSFSGSKVVDYNTTASPWAGMGYYPQIAPDETL